MLVAGLQQCVHEDLHDFETEAVFIEEAIRESDYAITWIPFEIPDVEIPVPLHQLSENGVPVGSIVWQGEVVIEVDLD